MLLLRKRGSRTDSADFALGGTTAITAGVVNVASVMAFFAFSSNVTGHAAIFAEELTKGHWHQTSVVVAWLSCFLSGAMVANVLVEASETRRSLWTRATPSLLQAGVLVAVGYYCQGHYAETLRETEILVGALLFSMGLQNGTVASVSGGVIKTTHLTGLFTDLGLELSMFARRKHRSNAALRFKLKLHLTILGGYMLGAVLGGLIYLQYQYVALHVAAAILLSILLHDAVLWWRQGVAAPVRTEGAGIYPSWPAE